jgi:ribosomal protein S3
MGQQLNPIGIRIGLHRKWKSNWFLEKKYYTNFLLLNFEINKYLVGVLRNDKITSFVINCYISKISLQKLYICIFLYRLRRPISRKSRKKKGGGKLDYKKLNLSFNINLKRFLVKKSFKQKNKDLLTLLNSKNKNILKINHYPSNKESLIKNSFKKIKIKKIKVKKKEFFTLQNLKKKNFKLIKKSLSELTSTKIHLVIINALSFLKFYEYLHEYSKLYKLTRQAEYERTFLSNQMISFYRYDVKLISDAINVIYIALILKQPLFLAQFIGYQFRKTPRNYRFGKIIQFLNQNITSVVKNRTEILGCRVQFKGRLGGRRTRRARKLQFINEGIMPLHSYNSKIEYGEAKGLTRFGVVGIKIWLCYQTKFSIYLQKDLILYFGYHKKKLIKKEKKKFNIMDILPGQKNLKFSFKNKKI